MARPPHARDAVIAAAEAVVRDIGAANLTFDELVRRSGITRGGILYHFPSKDALLAALVDNDLAQWEACIAAKRAQTGGSAAADLAAYIASGTEPDEDTARLCAGLLSAASAAKLLNEPWRRFYARHHRRIADASADPDLSTLLMLAAEGLFWLETFSLSPLSASQRQRVVARMLALADSTAKHTGAADAMRPPRKAPAPRTRKAGRRERQ